MACHDFHVPGRQSEMAPPEHPIAWCNFLHCGVCLDCVTECYCQILQVLDIVADVSFDGYGLNL